MAGEWIKVETPTPDKPEVFRIARALRIDADAAFGKLMRLWMWFDANSVDGHVDGVVSTDVDRVCRHDGFAAACVSVGWLAIDDAAEHASLPNFDRHNGETAKKRALKNKRQRKWRVGVDACVDGHVDALASTGASTREEKRREEKKEQKTAPDGEWFEGVPEQVVHDFKALRRKLRAEVTKTAMDGIKREAARAGITLTDALRMCCERGWRGFKAEWVQDRGGQRGGDADQASPASMRRLA